MKLIVCSTDSSTNRFHGFMDVFALVAISFAKISACEPVVILTNCWHMLVHPDLSDPMVWKLLEPLY